MSIFYCSRCGRNRDSDFVDIVDDPKSQYELMCLIHQEEDEEDEKPLATENEGK